MSVPLARNKIDSSRPLQAERLVELELTGHLTRASLEDALKVVDSALLAAERVTLLVDCSKMTGYDTAARELFVVWNQRSRARVRRLAVVTERAMWHLVVVGMALASGQPMKPFDRRGPAERWLRAP